MLVDAIDQCTIQVKEENSFDARHGRCIFELTQGYRPGTKIHFTSEKINARSSLEQNDAALERFRFAFPSGNCSDQSARLRPHCKPYCDKEDLLEPMLDDPKLTERLFRDEEALVRVTPHMLFSALLADCEGNWKRRRMSLTWIRRENVSRSLRVRQWRRCSRINKHVTI